MVKAIAVLQRGSEPGSGPGKYGSECGAAHTGVTGSPGKELNPIPSPTLPEEWCFHLGDNERKWLIKWKRGSCLTFTTMGCYHEFFQMAGDWLKVMIDHVCLAQHYMPSTQGMCIINVHEVFAKYINLYDCAWAPLFGTSAYVSHTLIMLE